MKVKVDLFPSHFSVAPSGEYENVSELAAQPVKRSENVFYVSKTRVVLWSNEENDFITVASDSPNGPQVVFQQKYLELTENDGIYRLLTPEGKMIAFEKDSNCGCGSRLRSWNPYRTLQSIKG
jgi:hypothetical protein